MSNSSTESNFIELLIPKMDVRKKYGMKHLEFLSSHNYFRSTMQIKIYNQNQN